MERLEYHPFVPTAASRSMMRRGTTRRSPRTATGCWAATSPPKFLAAVLVQPRVKQLLSSDHFSVDGALTEAQASVKTSSPGAATAKWTRSQETDVPNSLDDSFIEITFAHHNGYKAIHRANATLLQRLLVGRLATR